MYNDRSYVSSARRSPYTSASILDTPRKLYNTSSDARFSSSLNRGKDGIFRPKSLYNLATEIDYGSSPKVSLVSSSPSSLYRREQSLPRSRFRDSSDYSSGRHRSNFSSNFNDNLSYLSSSSSSSPTYYSSSPSARLSSSYYRGGAYSSGLDYGSRYHSFTKTNYTARFRERPLLTNLNLKYGSRKKVLSSSITSTSTSSRHASTSSTTSSHHNSASSLDNTNNSSLNPPTLERNKFLIKFREHNADISPAKRRDSISWHIPASFTHSSKTNKSEKLSQTIEENEIEDDVQPITVELGGSKTIDRDELDVLDNNNNLVRWNGTLSLNTERDDQTAQVEPLGETIETIADCLLQACCEQVTLPQANTTVDCQVKHNDVKPKVDKVKKKKKKSETKEESESTSPAIVQVTTTKNEQIPMLQIAESSSAVQLKPTLVKPNEAKPKKNKSVNFSLDIPDNKLSLPKSAPPSPQIEIKKLQLVESAKGKQEAKNEKPSSKPEQPEENLSKKNVLESKIYHKKEIPSFHATVIPSDVTVIKVNDKAQTNKKPEELKVRKATTELVPPATPEIVVENEVKAKSKVKSAKLLETATNEKESPTESSQEKMKSKARPKSLQEGEGKLQAKLDTLLIKPKTKQKKVTPAEPIPVLARIETIPPVVLFTTTTETVPASIAQVGQALKSRSSKTDEKKAVKKIKSEANNKANETGKIKKKKVKKALTENLSASVNTITPLEAEDTKAHEEPKQEDKKCAPKLAEAIVLPKPKEPKLPEAIVPPKPKEPKKIRFREYCLDDFVMLAVLGRGSFGKVLLAELRDHGVYFAIKCLKKHTVIEDDDVESIMIERKVLALGSSNPFICKLFATFQDETTLFFAMEWCAGGDLMFHVQKDGKFSEERTRFYACEMLCALWFLHKRGIIYRDLKLDNVMIYKDGHIRLVDFGMCQGKIYREELLPSNFCGTVEYMAPEIVKGVKYNHSVDYWALGVVIYEMIVGTSPFHGTDEDELLWNVCNQEVQYPRTLGDNIKNILVLLLKKDPKERLGVTMSYGHIKDQAWFEGINWSLAEQAKLRPPFVPQLECETDVSYFDQYFTKEEPVVSSNAKAISDEDQQCFEGFNYTNPNMTE